jgi:hypothetical protein
LQKKGIAAGVAFELSKTFANFHLACARIGSSFIHAKVSEFVVFITSCIWQSPVDCTLPYVEGFLIGAGMMTSCSSILEDILYHFMVVSVLSGQNR